MDAPPVPRFWQVRKTSLRCGAASLLTSPVLYGARSELARKRKFRVRGKAQMPITSSSIRGEKPLTPPSPRKCGAREKKALPPRPQFQAFQSGRDADADLALHAERLQRDRIVRSADQRVAADADAERRAALRTGVVAGKVARPKPRHRRKHAPGQHRLLGDAEIESDLADGRDIAVFRHALGAQHAAEIGHRADDEPDTGAAAAFENANLHALHRLLRVGPGDRCHRDESNTGKDG